MKQRGNAKRNVIYYAPGRKRPIAESTKATSDFLAYVHKQHPDKTINELKRLLEDRTVWLRNLDALAVLDAYIKIGCGDEVIGWR